jgi:pyruvate dehydrogenase E2 component (dihydrolipoamide acetyltransferase)
MSVVDIVVPDLGDFHDVPVIEVLIKPGETIAQDAPLVTLESEKSSMEVPASHGGVVRDVKVHVGDKVSTGSVLASVEVAEAAPAQASPPTAPPEPQAAAAPLAASTAPSTAPARDATLGAASAVHASPAIRRLAREFGVELGGVRGSGPNGRITRDDVQSFVKRALSTTRDATRAGVAGLSLPPWPVVDFAKYGPIERMPLPRIKKLSGSNVHRNWVMIPHVTHDEDADVTDLEALRKDVNDEQKDVKVTMLAFLMKASVAALRRFPDFNASLDGEELVLKRYYNIGFAADTPGGLVVPVVRDADKRGVLDIARETAALSAKARDGKLGMNEMQGGTFTISSLGGIGGTSFTPIVNAPEVAILGVTRAAIRPVWDGAAFRPRLILPLSLSYDHRVIDGAAAARFCTYLAGLLTDMRRTLL